MKFPLSNHAYNNAKYIAVIGLPTLATLVAGLGALWGFSLITEVVGTITLIDTALGSLLLLSTAEYNKQEAASTTEVDVVVEDDEADTAEKHWDN